jgi:hypothetical protein
MSTRPIVVVTCLVLMCVLVAGAAPDVSAQAKPEGEMPRVAEPALMLINPYPWSAPLEEVKLKPGR